MTLATLVVMLMSASEEPRRWMTSLLKTKKRKNSRITRKTCLMQRATCIPINFNQTYSYRTTYRTLKVPSWSATDSVWLHLNRMKMKSIRDTRNCTIIQSSSNKTTRKVQFSTLYLMPSQQLYTRTYFLDPLTLVKSKTRNLTRVTFPKEQNSTSTHIHRRRTMIYNN